LASGAWCGRVSGLGPGQPGSADKKLERQASQLLEIAGRGCDVVGVAAAAALGEPLHVAARGYRNIPIGAK
jgi:hypothetical protein